jgi:hypothetical protein
LQTVELPMPDGRALSFEVRDVPSSPALFALGVRKSGSSLMTMLLTRLAKVGDVPVVRVSDAAFAEGYRYPDWNGNPRLGDILRPGNLYSGFREAPTGLHGHPLFQNAPKLLLVRDPRDALVSEYFSTAFSHRLPERNAEASPVAVQRGEALAGDVESFVLARAAELNRTIDGYAALLDDPKLRLFRYEEVIFDKPAWIRAMLAHFGWRAPGPLIERLIDKHDIRPAEERPTEFIRKVAPGDHRDKLSADVIARLNATLSPTWRRLGYALD